jgi:hypothetical protein
VGPPHSEGNTMQFFVISTSHGSVVDCTMSLHAAKQVGLHYEPTGSFTVDRVNIDTRAPVEVIRRLLGNCGGYAQNTTRVYPTD